MSFACRTPLVACVDMFRPSKSVSLEAMPLPESTTLRCTACRRTLLYSLHNGAQLR